MSTLTKMAIVAALVFAPASGVALAKSQKASVASGNVVTQTHVKKHVAKRHIKRTTTGAAPSVRAPSNVNSPASCGGGSIGYNEKCLQPGE